MLTGACFMAVLAMSIMLQMVVVFDYTLDAVQHFFVSGCGVYPELSVLPYRRCPQIRSVTLQISRKNNHPRHHTTRDLPA